MDFTNPIIYGVPCFLGLILVELAYSKHHKKSEKKAQKETILGKKKNYSVNIF